MEGGYGYAPETHLYYVVVLSPLQAVQMRLQLSDVCGEGRVVAGASGYEFMRVNEISDAPLCQ